MKKKPDDLNLIAVRIVSETTKSDQGVKPTKNPAAVTLGRLGGLKGGKARAIKLSSERRKAIARKAANTRWAKNRKTSS